MTTGGIALRAGGIAFAPVAPRCRRMERGAMGGALLLAGLLHAALIFAVERSLTPAAPAMAVVAVTLVPAAAAAEASPAAAPLAAVPEAVAAPRPAGEAALPPAPSARGAPAAPKARRTPHGYAALVRSVASVGANAVPAPGAPRVRRLRENVANANEEAWYLAGWRRKVERVGNLNYPEAARAGKLQGSLRLLVAIGADGALRAVRVLESSGHPALDAAALRIVRLAAPFAPLPPAMRRNTDVLEIVRTWQFRRNRRSLVLAHAAAQNPCRLCVAAA